MYTTGCFFLNLLYWFKITTLSAGRGMVEPEHSYIHCWWEAQTCTALSGSILANQELGRCPHLLTHNCTFFWGGKLKIHKKLFAQRYLSWNKMGWEVYILQLCQLGLVKEITEIDL